MNTRKIYQRFAAIVTCLFTLTACGGDEPITTPVKIVAFGDSLTAGYRLAVEDSFPSQLQARFTQDGHSGVRIENQGISGDTTGDGLQRLNKVIEARPDIVILELGANDILRSQPADKARSNLANIISQLHAEGITVLLSGIRVSGLASMHGPTGAYKELFHELAEQHGTPLYGDFLKGVMGKKNLNLPDGLHPNREGVSIIVDGIYPQVRKLAAEVASKKAAAQ